MKILASLIVFVLITISAPHVFAQDTASSKDVPANNSADSYKLGAGDRLKVTVFGEDALSGEFEIDGQGMVSLPLIGNLKAGGSDVRSLENNFADKLKDGYLVSPRVSIEVLNFRPFFILGEVKNPGSYPYVNGLTVLNAVALAGGFTHRARTDQVLIRHGSDAKEKEFGEGEDGKVLPGDVIRVTERFF
jgi:protein involved in polysaccharide export with SLBB domain